MYLPKGSIMSWSGNDLSEHNRSPVNVSFEKIETAKRMSNGTMRKYVIGYVRTFSLSWKELPDSSSATVDKKWGGREIEDFYERQFGEFIMTIKNGAGQVENYTVFITDFSKTLNKRGKYDAWDIDVTLEEVYANSNRAPAQ